MKEGLVLEIKNSDAVIMTKEGQFISIDAHEDWTIGQKVHYNDIELKKQHYIPNNNKTKSVWKYKSILIALVASLLFFIVPFSMTSQASTFITLDINPSIQLEVSKDKVIQLTPLNEDGEKIIRMLPDEDKTGNVYDVTAKIIEAADHLGYLSKYVTDDSSDTENFIMVGILDEKGSFKTSKYKEYLQQNLENIKVKAEIMVLNATKKDKKTADHKGISIGKYMLQEKEKQQGIVISDEEIKKQSINDIMNQVKNKNKEKEKEKPKSNNGKSDKKGNSNSNGKSADQSDKRDNQPNKNDQKNTNNGNHYGNDKKGQDNSDNEETQGNSNKNVKSRGYNEKEKKENNGNSYGKFKWLSNNLKQKMLNRQIEKK